MRDRLEDIWTESICELLRKELDSNRVIKAPRVLGIDEAHLNKTMRGVFTDTENNILLEISADNKKKTAKYWCIEEWIFIQKHFACDPPLSRKRLRALNGGLTAENISWTPQIQGEHGRENAAEYEVFTAKFEFCWKNKRRKWPIAQKERSISVRNDNDQKISSKKQENMLVKDLTRRGWMNYNPSIKNE